VTFAVGQWFFGVTDPDGGPDKANGWKHFGFDLDGQISEACAPGSFASLCMVRDRASSQVVQQNGDDGIDNAFGGLILPILLGVSSSFSLKANDDLSLGGQTLLLDLENLGTGTDYFPLTARLYDGAPLGKRPARDGSDVWPVRADLLTDPTNVGSSKLQTTTSYVVGNTWVARFHGDLPIKTTLSGIPLTLLVNDPLIAMTLDPQHQTVTGGTIAGVIATDTLVAEARYVAALYDPTDLCSGPTLDSILKQITQASDILADGTQDPTKPCTGISIGLGFDAYRVQLGPIAPPETPPPSPCTDAGTGDAGSGDGGADGGDGG
jgi:hypothetical protein